MRLQCGKIVGISDGMFQLCGLDIDHDGLCIYLPDVLYVSTRDRFMQECERDGINKADAEFLAELEFDETGEPRPESIYALYRKPM